ncbi:SGNH/GDSL hydrolase family protein [bacterium]|nr:SGNH/GDSL hydrolase family protein [bacterium]
MTARRRPILFAVIAAVLAFAMMNALVAAFGLHEIPAEGIFKDPFAVALELYPGSHAPFAGDENLNNLGLRGPAPRVEKPAGSWRLLSVGDSTTYGYRVPLAAAYTTRLARRLAALGPWETINAGVPGTSILQHRILFDTKWRAFRADLVLVYTQPAVLVEFDAARKVFEAGGAWSPAPPSRARRLLRRVPLYAAMRNLLRGPLARRLKTHLEQAAEVGLDADDERRMADTFARDIEGLGRSIRESGARPVWIVPASRTPANRFAQTDRVPAREDVVAFMPYLDRLYAYASQNGDPLVDPHARMAEATRRGEDPWQDEVHPTARGHAIMADAIAPVVEGAAREIMDARGAGEARDTGRP